MTIEQGFPLDVFRASVLGDTGFVVPETANWAQFERFIDEFDFRRFYDALSHVCEYVLGERTNSSLTAPEKRMMNSAWMGLDLHEDVRGVVGKLRLACNTLRASWKYQAFSQNSMMKAL